MENIVGVSGLARYLDVSPWTVRRLADNGEIPGFRVGNRWRFFPSEVVAALKAPKVEQLQPARSNVRRRRAA